MKRVLLIGFVLVFVVGCATMTPIPVNPEGTPRPTNKKILYWDYSYGDVVRHIDYEASVVCYLFKATDSAGIECVPLSETSLDYEH